MIHHLHDFIYILQLTGTVDFYFVIILPHHFSAVFKCKQLVRHDVHKKYTYVSAEMLNTPDFTFGIERD